MAKREIRNVSGKMKPKTMEGIYMVEEFNLVNQSSSPLTTDSLRWKKMATRYDNDMAIQYANGTLKFYKYKMDSTSKTFTLQDTRDTNNKSEFVYIMPSPKHYLFEGIMNSDSVRIHLRKFDMDSLPLVKNRGKIKWYQ